MSKAIPAPMSPTQETYGRVDQRTRRLAVFGPRGSGKTSYFASLYGHSSGDEGTVTAADDISETYLANQWAAYESAAGFPDPTAREVPARINFEVADGATRQIWQAQLLDHAGELIETGNGQDDDLRRLVQSWLRECEGVMVFLDTGKTTPDKALKRRDEVTRLLRILREQSESLRITKPLALVLTKWDEHEGGVGSTEDAARRVNSPDWNEKKTDPENQELLAYLSKVPGYRQIQGTLDSFGDRCKVFLMSAVGTDRKPRKKPESAFGLLPPLVWLLTESDQERLAVVERQAARVAPMRALELYKSLIVQGIEAGPVHALVNTRIADLQRRLRRRWWTRAVVVATLLLVCLEDGWLTWKNHANRQYDAWTAYCASPEGSTPATAEKRRDMAESLRFYHGSVLPRDSIARLDEVILRDREVERDYTEGGAWKGIEAGLERREHVAFPDRRNFLQDLEQKLVAFGEKWGGRTAGADWQKRLTEVRGQLATIARQTQGYEEVEKQAHAREEMKDVEGAVTAWQQFLKSDPPPYYGEKALACLQTLKGLHDVQVINGLASEAESEFNTEDKCARFIVSLGEAERKLSNPALHRETIKRLRDKVLTRADELVYREAVMALDDARRSMTINQIRMARSKVGRYLEQTTLVSTGFSRPVLMRDNALLAQQWLDRFESGQEYKLDSGTLVVPKGHNLFNNSLGASSSYAYSLTFSGAISYDPKVSDMKTPSTDTTVKGDGNEVSVNISKVLNSYSFKYKPEDAQGLTVVVWRSGFTGWYQNSASIDGSLFVPAVLVNGVTVKDPAGKELTLTIQCSGATIPSLPPYIRR